MSTRSSDAVVPPIFFRSMLATIERPLSPSLTFSTPEANVKRKLSSQLSHESVESSGLFGGFGHLELRRVWVEGDGGYEAPIAGLS